MFGGVLRPERCDLEVPEVGIVRAGCDHIIGSVRRGVRGKADGEQASRDGANPEPVAQPVHRGHHPRRPR